MTGASKSEMLRMMTQASFPYLIEITTPDGNVYRYANSDSDKTFGGNTYYAAFFKPNPPEVRDGEVSEASITISAIDLEWIARIRNTQQRSTIKFVAAISRDSNDSEVIEEIDARSYTLTAADWNRLTIDWRMEFDPLSEIQIPVDECNKFVCPGNA